MNRREAIATSVILAGTLLNAKELQTNIPTHLKAQS